MNTTSWALGAHLGWLDVEGNQPRAALSSNDAVLRPPVMSASAICTSKLVTDIIDQASKVKQTIKKKKREAKLASTSPKLPHEKNPTKIVKRA
ncbi:hypothetical protein PF008_g28601 [Phytophthora fragariae]|uniref:Uncharacterized protein n=1 Tax=Phytophthora fragariae TaxID=53985 RepID=A0A6G0QBI5_9STRA|nr:hypothetical protein PF008_g28601 [Phytophthora fragariae]